MEEDVSFYFSVAEKKAFLERHGYVIERIHFEEEINIYQNVFTGVLTVKDVAVKDGKQHDIHRLFQTILRQKLLAL